MVFVLLIFLPSCELIGKAKVEKTSTDAALKLSELRTQYVGLLNELDQFKLAGVPSQWQQEVSGRCWYTKRGAYRLLVKLLDEGADVREAAAGFGWSQEQLGNPHLREWLCGIC